MILSRRGLFGIGAAFLAAPAIVRVASIMPVSVVKAQGREYLHTLEAPGWLNLDDVDVCVTIQQSGCLYGYTEKTWELRRGLEILQYAAPVGRLERAARQIPVPVGLEGVAKRFLPYSTTGTAP